MKSVKNIFDDVVTYDNIMKAINKASRGKMYKRQVKKTVKNSYLVAKELYDQLTKGTWEPIYTHTGRMIGLDSSSKPRLVIYPLFAQELVINHLIVAEVLLPIFKKSFYQWSCGSVPGKGQEIMEKYLYRKVKAQIDAGKKIYVAKLDVKKFFNNVNVEALKDLLHKKIHDKRVTDIIDKILAANKVIQMDNSVFDQGLPMGYYTSPWFANIILNKVDHVVKDKHRVDIYARFMDDMILFDTNKRKLKKAIEAAQEVLAEFGLSLKHEVQVHDFTKTKSVRFTGFQLRLVDRLPHDLPKHRKGALLKNGADLYLLPLNGESKPRFYPRRKQPRYSLIVKVHGPVFLRGRRQATRMAKRIDNHGRVTAHQAQQMMSYFGRFKAFHSRYAFYTQYCKSGKISPFILRRKISMHAKDKAGKLPPKDIEDSALQKNQPEQKDQSNDHI